VPATNGAVDVGRRRDGELRCRGEGSGRRGDDRGTRAPTRDRERQRDERGWYPHSEKLLGGGWRGERPLVDGPRTHRHTRDGVRGLYTIVTSGRCSTPVHPATFPTSMTDARNFPCR